MSQPDTLIAIEVEAALLGAMLLDNALADQLSDTLTVKDFAEPLHGRIFSAILRFRAKGANANAMTLKPVFSQDEAAMHGEYLAKLTDNPAVAIGAKDFAAQLTDFALRRRVRERALEALTRIEGDFETPVVEIVAPVQETAQAFAFSAEEAPALGLPEMVRLIRERRARINAGDGSIGATNALIADVDKAIGPLERGTYTVVAGRPGMGKSALASSLSLGYSMNGTIGLYLQGEMTEEQQAMRTISDASFAFGRGIPHADIRHNRLDEGQMHWFDQIEAKLEMIPLEYKAIGHASIRRIEALIARHCAMAAAQGKELGFVVIDQLSFVTAQDSEGREIDDDRKRMNAVSKALAGICKRYNVAIIALAQLSRSLEARQNKRPVLADLKETGKLEEDADTVLFVYREEYYLKDQEPKKGTKDPRTNRDLWEEWDLEMRACRGKVDLIIGKNRHDETRTRTAQFFGKFYAIRGGDFDEHRPSEDLPF